MEGYLFGIPAIAFSLVETGWPQLDAAARAARAVVEQVLRDPPSGGPWLLNVNIPAVDAVDRADVEVTPPRPPPCERAGGAPDQSARRADLLDRPGRQCPRGGHRHRLPCHGARPRLGHAAAGRPHRPCLARRLAVDAREGVGMSAPARPVGRFPMALDRLAGADGAASASASAPRAMLRPQAPLRQAASDAARRRDSVRPRPRFGRRAAAHDRAAARRRRARDGGAGRDGGGAAASLRRRRLGQPGLRGHQPADRPRPDDLQAVGGRAHDRAAASAAPMRAPPGGSAACSRSAAAAATRRRCWRGWRAGWSRSSACKPLHAGGAAPSGTAAGKRGSACCTATALPATRPEAPYDGIIAAAGGDALPQAWLDQLAPGGRLVAPVRGSDGGAGAGGRRPPRRRRTAPVGTRDGAISSL